MGECNPACQKIIINSGLMAPAAELLAAVAPNVVVRDTANRLATVASRFVKMFEHATKYGIITRNPAAHSFHGCDQAKTIMSWVANWSPGGDGERAQDAISVSLMDRWADDLIAQMSALVRGEEIK